MPIQTVLRLADAMADASGLLRRPLEAEKLVAAAERHTGLTDFGEAFVVEPLRRLLVACQQEASLSLVGRIATKWDTARFLSNLLHMRDAEARDPGVLRERIERPIFITGLPRSGTTFLHRLMMADPANRTPLVWQTIYPYPNGRLSRGGRDGRKADVARQLGRFERLAPEFRSLHPLEADSPQECSEITAHVFRSLRFDTTYRIPSYRAWLDGAGHLPAYRFHQRFLQHLQHQDGGGRWVLKCPDHLFALDALRAVYPDARLVFVHRDPARVLMSVARLTEVLRRPFTRTIDRAEIGRQESARWREGAQRMVEAGDGVGPEPICHVHHTDLVRDPVGTVEAVYRHFGQALSEAGAAAVARYAGEEPTGGYGVHHYRFEEYGLDEAAERQKFGLYMQRFGIEPEGGGATRRPVASAA